MGGREPIGKKLGFEDDIVNLRILVGIERGFILEKQGMGF